MPRMCLWTSPPTLSTMLTPACLPQLVPLPWVAQENGAASVGSDLQDTVVSESTLWFSNAAKATTSGMSQLFWGSVEVRNEERDRNALCPTSCCVVPPAPEKRYSSWSHTVPQRSCCLNLTLPLLLFTSSLSWCHAPKHSSPQLVLSVKNKRTGTTSQQITNPSPQNKTKGRQEGAQRDWIKRRNLCGNSSHWTPVLREGHLVASPRTMRDHWLFIYVTRGTWSSDSLPRRAVLCQKLIEVSTEKTTRKDNLRSITWLSRWVAWFVPWGKGLQQKICLGIWPQGAGLEGSKHREGGKALQTVYYSGWLVLLSWDLVSRCVKWDSKPFTSRLKGRRKCWSIYSCLPLAKDGLRNVIYLYVCRGPVIGSKRYLLQTHSKVLWVAPVRSWLKPARIGHHSTGWRGQWGGEDLTQWDLPTKQGQEKRPKNMHMPRSPEEKWKGMRRDAWKGIKDIGGK